MGSNPTMCMKEIMLERNIWLEKKVFKNAFLMLLVKRVKYLKKVKEIKDYWRKERINDNKLWICMKLSEDEFEEDVEWYVKSLSCLKFVY